jgi:hypothetical protein
MGCQEPRACWEETNDQVAQKKGSGTRCRPWWDYQSIQSGVFRKMRKQPKPWTSEPYLWRNHFIFFQIVHSSIFSYCLFIYSYVHTLFEPSLPPPLYLPCNQFSPLLQFCWRENVRDNKKDIRFLLAWDKDSCTERFLELLPCTCVLQPKLVHLCQTSSLLPGHFPTVASVILRLLYSLLYSRHIKHFQVLGFLPILIPPVCARPLSCDPSPTTLLHLPYI